MAKYAKTIIELAKSWVGRNEADGTHKYIIDIYNGYRPLARNYKVKYTDAWCATTISALAIKLGYTDIIPTECGCGQMIELFKQKGIWVENENRTPNPADIIFYDWQDNGVGDNKGWSDHVGIVEKVENGKITVIEGNYKNAVTRRVIAVNGKYIRGYGVPKYDKEVASTPTSTKKEELKVDGDWGRATTLASQKAFGTIEDGEISHQLSSCKKYLPNCLTASWEFDDTGKGSNLIRKVQTFLSKEQYKNKIDGLCGEKTVMAMQDFLKANGFNCGNTDGIMGEKTVMAWQEYVNSLLK